MRGAPFEMFKFRTIRDAVDGAGNLLPDAERLTQFGRMLTDLAVDWIEGAVTAT